MNNFYNGDDHKNILKLLIKKGRESKLTINVLCENEIIVKEISSYLWNNSIPHYIKDDPYIEKNKVFISEKELPADMLICYECEKFQDLYNYKKKCFIGVQKKLEGNSWIIINGRWQKVE